MYRYKDVVEKLETEKVVSEKVVFNEIDVEKTCSICGRTQFCSLETNTWHQIAVYHCDRGVDFRDTYKFFDICSFECYLKQVRSSLDELENSKTGRIDGMDLKFVQKLLFFYGA